MISSAINTIYITRAHMLNRTRNVIVESNYKAATKMQIIKILTKELYIWYAIDYDIIDEHILRGCKGTAH